MASWLFAPVASIRSSDGEGLAATACTVAAPAIGAKPSIARNDLRFMLVSFVKVRQCNGPKNSAG
ncbi:hypothetical protein C1M53_27595 [Mesorhizobium sp. Pch-S]|nr:hypothetical protein C1M53_27595 [Mesorhizobium sp. Pch-S]